MRNLLIIFFGILLISANVCISAEKQLSIEQLKELDSASDLIEAMIDNEQYSQACFMAYELTQRYPKQPEGYFLLGKARSASGYYKQAIEAYNQCLAVDKTFYQALFNRGFVKYTKKQYKSAIKDYNKVLSMSNIDNETKMCTYTNRALAKYFDGDLQGALQDYNKVFGIDNNLKIPASVYYNRGLCRYDLGNKDGANEDYKKARKLDKKAKFLYYDKRG